MADGWNDFASIYPIEDEDSGESTPCEAPTISYSNGKLIFNSSTTGAEYHHTITSADIVKDSLNTGEVTLAACYNISAYATADGYAKSEATTATLYWLDGSLSEPTDISAAKSRGVVVTAQGGIITISGLDERESVSLYTIDSKPIGTATAVNGTASLATSATGVVIAKIGGESIKIQVK